MKMVTRPYACLALTLGILSCARIGPAGIENATTPQLAVSATSLGFAPDQVERAITLTNRGSQPVAWSAAGTAAWLTVTPSSATAAPGATSIVVKVTRSGLAPGTHSGQVRITAADLVLDVEVTAEVDARPIASLDATALDLAAAQASATARLSNAGNAPLAWSMSGPAWVAIAPAAGTIPAGAAQTITLTPDRSTLPPGTHQANVTLTSDGGGSTLALRVEVAAPARLRVEPTAVGFGTAGQTVNVTIANDGGLPLTWTAAPDQAWLSVSRAAGTLAPASSVTVVLTGSRQGLAPGTHRAGLSVSSNGGAEAVEATIDVVQDPEPPTAALSGMIVDQFTGRGIRDLTVRYGGATATTDEGGRFSVPGAPSSSLRSLTIAGSDIHARSTFARSSDSRWLAIPSWFDMSAFNDVARDYEPRTIRWLQRPNVYIDTRHVGPDAGPQLATWIAEARATVEGFIDDWSNGAIGAASVTVGSSPPPNETVGWIIIRFDDDASHYTGATTVGNARTGWGSRREILYSTISLRFSIVPGTDLAWARTAILGHELGHALGMGHMEGFTPSIMTPRISLAALSTFDSGTGSIVYSRSPGNVNPDSDSEAFFVGGLAPAGVPSGENRWVCDGPDLTP